MLSDILDDDAHKIECLSAFNFIIVSFKFLCQMAIEDFNIFEDTITYMWYNMIRLSDKSRYHYKYLKNLINFQTQILYN